MRWNIFGIIFQSLADSFYVYSNKSRGLREKAGTDDQVPALIESDISSKEFRKNWAQKIT